MKRLPEDMEGAFDDLRDAAERMAEKLAPPKRGDHPQRELGFQVQEVNLDTVRGNFDLSRLEGRNPKLVRAIAFMLGLHYLPWDVIATACGTDWETVAAVAEGRKESIREFKGRMSKRLALVLEAGTPVLLDKIRRGQWTALDQKLAHEVWGGFAGEATSIVEKREGPPALQRFEEVLREALEMGSEVGKISAEGAPGLGLPGGPVLDVEFVEVGAPRDTESTDKVSQPVDKQ